MRISILKNDLKRLAIPIFILIPYFILMQLVFGTVCPFKAITGINCPGCGLTHSVIYFFMGRFPESFHSNQSVLLWILSITLFIIDRYIYKLKKNIVYCAFILTAIITIVIYMINIIT